MEERQFIDFLEDEMLMKLPNPTEKFLFVFLFKLGRKQVEASRILQVNETNISRHVLKIRKRLQEYRPVKNPDPTEEDSGI